MPVLSVSVYGNVEGVRHRQPEMVQTKKASSLPIVDLIVAIGSFGTLLTLALLIERTTSGSSEFDNFDSLMLLGLCGTFVAVFILTMFYVIHRYGSRLWKGQLVTSTSPVQNIITENEIHAQALPPPSYSSVVLIDDMPPSYESIVTEYKTFSIIVTDVTQGDVKPVHTGPCIVHM